MANLFYFFNILFSLLIDFVHLCCTALKWVSINIQYIFPFWNNSLWINLATSWINYTLSEISLSLNHILGFLCLCNNSWNNLVQAYGYGFTVFSTLQYYTTLFSLLVQKSNYLTFSFWCIIFGLVDGNRLKFWGLCKSQRKKHKWSDCGPWEAYEMCHFWHYNGMMCDCAIWAKNHLKSRENFHVFRSLSLSLSLSMCPIPLISLRAQQS